MAADSLKELTQRAEVDKRDARKYSIKSWISAASKLYDEGSMHSACGNLEEAYVCYMKGCSVMVEIIAKHPQFNEARRDSLYSELENLTKMEVLDTLESLKEKLRAQNSNDDVTDVQRVTEKYPPLPGLYSDAESVSNSPSSLHSVPPSLNDLSLDDMPSVPTHKPTRSNALAKPSSRAPAPSPSLVSQVTSPVPKPPTQPVKSSIGFPARTSNEFPQSMVVEPRQLAKWITRKDNPPSILILDVRPREVFASECIKHKWVVQIEPFKLRKDMSSAMILDSLVANPEIEQQLFEARHSKFDLVVYYDQDSSSAQDAGEPLRHLKTAIYELEFQYTLPRVPMMLAGGFNAWKKAIGDRGVYSFKKSSPSDKTQVETSGPKARWSAGNIDRGQGYGDAKLVTVHHTLYDYFNHKAMEPRLQSMSRSGEQHTHPPLQGIFNHTLSTSRSPSKPPITMTMPRPRPAVSPSDTKESISFPYPDIQPNSSLVPHDSEYGPTSLKRHNTFIDNPFHGFTMTSNHTYDAPPVPAKPTRPLPPTPVKSPGKRLAPPGPPRPPPITPPAAREPTITRSHFAPVSSSSFSQLGSVMIGTTGLKNLGNTCFMNSIIQCLSGTIPLARYFISGMYKQHINKSNPLGTGGVLAESFTDLLRVMWSENYNFISPVTFRGALVKFAPQFDGTEQHDSQEFLAFLLDGLHEDVNTIVKRPSPLNEDPEEEQRFEQLPDWQASGIAWEKYLARNGSVVVSLFQGQYRSRLTCLTCKQTSTSYNTFMSLSLPIPAKSDDRVSLYRCLDYFVAEEILDGDNAWRCTRCNVKRRTTKTLTLSKLPDVLLVHLKRFSYNGPFRDKLDTDVEFPTKGLDLSRFISETMLSPHEERPSFTYDLYGVSNHYGSLTGGHYTACVRNGYRGEWHNFDDTRFSVCDENKVKTRAAYNLFYVRSTVQ